MPAGPAGIHYTQDSIQSLQHIQASHGNSSLLLSSNLKPAGRRHTELELGGTWNTVTEQGIAHIATMARFVVYCAQITQSRLGEVVAKNNSRGPTIFLFECYSGLYGLGPGGVQIFSSHWCKY